MKFFFHAGITQLGFLLMGTGLLGYFPEHKLEIGYGMGFFVGFTPYVLSLVYRK